MKNYYSVFKRLVKIAPNRPQFILPKLFTLAFIALLLATIVAVILNHFFCFADFGQIGDFFNGIIGPFLSLITILLVYATYQVQKKELTATLEELRKTAESMQDQRKIMEMQEETQRQTRCDNLLFEMLKMYKMDFKDNEKVLYYDIRTYLCEFYKASRIEEAILRYNKTMEDMYKSKEGIDLSPIYEISLFLAERIRDSEKYIIANKIAYQLITIYKSPILGGVIRPEYYKQIREFMIGNLSHLERLILHVVLYIDPYYRMSALSGEIGFLKEKYEIEIMPDNVRIDSKCKYENEVIDIFFLRYFF